MAPPTSELWRLAGEAWAAFLAGYPGAVARRTPHGWLALSGEPLADLNFAYVGAADQAAEHLREFGEAIRARGVPALVALAPAVADRLAPLARELGLQPLGGVPLMAYQPAGEPAAVPDVGAYAVGRITDPGDLPAVHGLLADAFGLPLDAAARLYAAPLLAQPGIAVFLARRAGEPVSTVTTSAAGAMVGIWSMATTPARQRQGAGRAALAAALARHRARGATTFYLIATEAGRPLYERTGFRTLEETPLWAAGHSVQFPGR